MRVVYKKAIIQVEHNKATRRWQPKAFCLVVILLIFMKRFDAVSYKCLMTFVDCLSCGYESGVIMKPYNFS